MPQQIMNKKNLLMCVVLMLCVGCNTVKVRVSADKPEMIEVSKLDPNIFADRVHQLSLDVKLPIPITPGGSYLNEVKMEWEVNVQILIARYMMLVADFNAGILALDQYMERRDALDKLLEELALDKVRLESKMIALIGEKELNIQPLDRADIEAILSDVRAKFGHTRKKKNE